VINIHDATLQLMIKVIQAHKFCLHIAYTGQNTYITPVPDPGAPDPGATMETSHWVGELMVYTDP
jgi:hypothetical protein